MVRKETNFRGGLLWKKTSGQTRGSKDESKTYQGERRQFLWGGVEKSWYKKILAGLVGGPMHFGIGVRRRWGVGSEAWGEWLGRLGEKTSCKLKPVSGGEGEKRKLHSVEPAGGGKRSARTLPFRGKKHGGGGGKKREHHGVKPP